jgi:hypothetical protein
MASGWLVAHVIHLGRVTASPKLAVPYLDRALSPMHLSRIGMDNRPYLSLKNPCLFGTPQQAVQGFAGSKHLP